MDILLSFDKEFEEVASAVARGEYLLWLGSGISRSVVPDVRALVKKVLRFLQEQVDLTDENCRFTRALGEILGVVRLSDESRGAIDISMPVEAWPGFEDLLDRLIDNYSAVLDVSVDGEAPDYLVWEGIDVCSTFGADGIEPDVEHLCVAILILEGVVQSIPTTNWDGLIEAAVKQLSAGSDSILRVLIRASDFTEPQTRSELLKFHGCAVCAVRDPCTFRHLLIARMTQISGWTSEDDNKIMQARLEYLLASQPALVIGLSAQDADIHTMLHEARKGLAREWPESPPAVVFAVERLDRHHYHMLKITYGDRYRLNRSAIDESALLGAFAKPMLIGLVLYVLGHKLCALITATIGERFGVPGAIELQGHIRALRDMVGQAAENDLRSFIDRFINAVTLVLSVFRWDSQADPAACYEPLTVKPIADAQADPNFSGDALGRLGIAASLLSRGLVNGLWTLDMGSAEDLGQGVVQVVQHGKAKSHVFLVRDAGVLSKLIADGHVKMNDPRVLIIHAEQIPERLQRSPKATYGRNGKPTDREVAIESLCNSATDVDDLFATFRVAAGL